MTFFGVSCFKYIVIISKNQWTDLEVFLQRFNEISMLCTMLQKYQNLTLRQYPCDSFREVGSHMVLVLRSFFQSKCLKTKKKQDNVWDWDSSSTLFILVSAEAGDLWCIPPRSGISGLSVWSHFTISLLFFCLVPLLFLSCPFLLLAYSTDFFFPKPPFSKM